MITPYSTPAPTMSGRKSVLARFRSTRVTGMRPSVQTVPTRRGIRTRNVDLAFRRVRASNAKMNMTA